MSRPLISPPITDDERPRLVALGAELRRARLNAGMTRAELADVTALNARTLARIEAGERRTRRRTLGVIASELSERPDVLLDSLVRLGGAAIAAESPYADRIEKRRVRRLRRIEVLEDREWYAAEREAQESRWAARAEAHQRFRANMRLIDAAFQELRRLGSI